MEPFDIDVHVFQENGMWVAKSENPDIVAQGETMEEARTSYMKTFFTQVLLDINNA